MSVGSTYKCHPRNVEKNVSNKHQKILVSWVVKDDHLLRGSRIIILEKLTSKELYSLLISAIDHQPNSKIYFDYLFPYIELTWKEIYLTPRKATANSHLRCFHYKIINNVLYLNKKLFQFGKSQSDLCFFCDTKAETSLHVFRKCSVIKILWNQLSKVHTIDFKLYVYRSRERGVLKLNSFIKNATKVKKLERKIASVCKEKTIQLNYK